MTEHQTLDSALIRQFGRLTAGRVLGVTAFLTLPIALFASKGVTPVFIVAAVLVLILSLGRRMLLAFPQPVSSLLIAFVFVAGTSALWSIEPLSSLRSTAVVALICFSGLTLTYCAARLTKEQRDFVERAIIAGGVLGLILVSFEQSSDWMLTRGLLQLKGRDVSSLSTLAPAFNPGMSIVALYVWPLLLIIKRRYGLWPMVLVLTAALILIFLGDAQTPFIALVIGLGVATASIFFRRAVFGLLAVSVIVGVISAPLVPGALPDPETHTSRYPYLSNSALHRLSIWRTAGERIAEKPVLGFGMNATRYLYNASDKIRRTYNTDDPSKKSWYNEFEPIPLHTHNGVLQIWLELGGLGALVFLAILLATLTLIYRKLENKASTATCLGVLTSGLFIFSSSFSPWQSWWHTGLWLIACFTVVAVSGGKPAQLDPASTQ